MIAFDTLKGLTSHLSSAVTVDHIGQALLSVSGGFGLTNVLILDTSKLFDRLGPAVLFTSADPVLIEAIDVVEPFVNGAVHSRAKTSDMPFLASETRRLLPPPDKKSWWNALPGERPHMDALIVPVHLHGKLVWGAGFLGDDPDLSNGARSLLSAAVHAAHERFLDLRDSVKATTPLSARESECLRWVTLGKTDFEVGKILEISPRTVRFHINNAKTKLGVSTRIQAVARNAGTF